MNKWDIIESIAVVFSLGSVLLAIKKSIHTWLTGLIGIIFYGILFYHEKLYADFILQIIFVGQSIAGYLNWEKEKEMRFTKYHSIVMGTSMILGGSVFYFFTAGTGNPQPFLDISASFLSIGALYLLVVKMKENWLLWIAANVCYIFLFFFQGLLLSTLLYVVFLILAIRGFQEWNNGTKK